MAYAASSNRGRYFVRKWDALRPIGERIGKLPPRAFPRPDEITLDDFHTLLFSAPLTFRLVAGGRKSVRPPFFPSLYGSRFDLSPNLPRDCQLLPRILFHVL